MSQTTKIRLDRNTNHCHNLDREIEVLKNAMRDVARFSAEFALTIGNHEYAEKFFEVLSELDRVYYRRSQ